MHILPYLTPQSPSEVIDTLDKKEPSHSFTPPIPLKYDKIDILTYHSHSLENSCDFVAIFNFKRSYCPHIQREGQ